MDSGYCGIDYGMGLSNRNSETGIHYGIISAHEVPYIWDYLEADYGDPYCPKCGTEPEDFDAVYSHADEARQEEIGTWEHSRGCNDYICTACEYIFDSQEAFSDEAVNHTYEDKEYSLLADNDGDLWVFKSPYYTLAAYCSPCAPGAGDLRAPRNNGVKTYCLGPEYWPHFLREYLACPYPVWRVSDDVQMYTPTVAQDETDA